MNWIEQGKGYVIFGDIVAINKTFYIWKLKYPLWNTIHLYMLKCTLNQYFLFDWCLPFLCKLLVIIRFVCSTNVSLYYLKVYNEKDRNRIITFVVQMWPLEQFSLDCPDGYLLYKIQVSVWSICLPRDAKHRAPRSVKVVVGVHKVPKSVSNRYY